MKNGIVILFLFLLTVLVVGCKKSSNPSVNTTTTNDSVTLKPNVVIVDSNSLKLVSTSDQLSQGIYVFSGNSTASNFVQNGIIIGITGRGYLRKITSITNQSGSIILNTQQARLEDIFQEGKINFSSSFSSLSRTTSTGGEYDFSLDNIQLFNNSVASLTLKHADIAFTPNWNFQVGFQNGSISNVNAGFQNGTLTANMIFDASASSSVNYTNSITLKSFSGTALIWIGVVPVVITTSLDFIANVTAGINASINSSVTITNSNSFNFGEIYNGSVWQNNYTFNPTTTVVCSPLSGSVGATITCDIVPQINVVLYDVVGPYASLPLNTYLNANVAAPSLNWDFTAGFYIQPTIGISASVLGYTLADYNTSWITDKVSYQTPYKVNKISGDNQIGRILLNLSQPIKVQVVDNLGIKQSNVPVSFSVSSAAVPVISITDANGYAQTTWALGSNLGSQAMAVSVKMANGNNINGSPITFTAYALNGTSTLPSLTTNSISSITQTSALSGGNITNIGTSSISMRGVCWNTSGGPTISDNFTSDGIGAGSYTSSLIGLVANTAYHVRAYATNSSGTTYGNEKIFTTLSNPFPNVTTDSITSITGTSAICGGSVTSSGSTTVTARGVCWATTANPTISNNHTTDGIGIGSFVSNISGLSSGATYYVRAYATNGSGTVYGEEREIIYHTGRGWFEI